MDHHDGPALLVLPAQHREPALGDGVGFDHVDDVLLRLVGVAHPALDRTGAVRPLPEDGLRDHDHPPASDTRNAATSRSARVPSGKSHRGRSPATGL